MINTLNKEIGDKDSTSKYKWRGQNEKRAKVPIQSNGEIQKSAKERETAAKNLDNVEDKWNKWLTWVAHEA